MFYTSLITACRYTPGYNGSLIKLTLHRHAGYCAGIRYKCINYKHVFKLTDNSLNIISDNISLISKPQTNENVVKPKHLLITDQDSM